MAIHTICHPETLLTSVSRTLHDQRPSQAPLNSSYAELPPERLDTSMS